MSQDSSKASFIRTNCALKKAAILAFLEHSQTFYIHCVPHPELLLGRRGLTEKEKQEGILLVFGPHSYRTFNMDNKFLCCELQFQRWEKIKIPLEAVSRTFDKGSQVIMQWTTLPSMPIQKDSTVLARGTAGVFNPKKRESISSKKKSKKDAPRVIQVDFSQNK